MTSSLGDEDGSITSSTVMMNVSASAYARELRGTPTDMVNLHRDNKRLVDLPKSMSSPSTPSQRPQANSGQQISPSTGQPTREGSPRSLNSESSHTTPAPRRPARGCKFEAGMAKARRRVPYSLGPEKLELEPEELKRKLGLQEETKLTSDIQELYSRLVPSIESEERRTRFVHKLESILQTRWPGQQITVSVFGSTGSYLGTSDSDVDICITTDCRELEHVCSIADLLDKNGMERVVCVSSAKVPIVKVWDPELQVACDMNVNNPIALENTSMIRSYIAIDERFRPLAMIVKYWAKKRILNDAALGGTLSSYTWISMVLNFLQTQNPPILPSLQQKSGLAPKKLNGVNVAFDKALDNYKGFGAQNQSSLGQLLFQFFRYYGHEFDYEENALSVRLGKVIPKSQKAWHLLQDNRLCVEEPFNISRNLANTADDTSMRGIHLELRRAFKLVAEGNLDMCCEQYEAGPEERKQTETFIHPTARPIIPQVPTQPAAQTHRNNRNNFRSGRHGNRSSVRRASNPTGRNSTYLHDLPFQMTPQELQLQAQHQQHLLHDQLFQQYQYLQLQEQELRMQLYHQSLRQRGLGPSQSIQQNGFTNNGSPDSASALSSNGPGRMAMSPSMFPTRYSTTSPFLRNVTPASGVMTNPASPLLGSAIPDNRRYTRRTSVTNSSPAGSLRAQSQPPRSAPFVGGFSQARPANESIVDRPDLPVDRRTSFPFHPQMFIPGYGSQPASASGSLYEAGRRPAEYMGYYVGQSPSLVANVRSTAISPIPSHAGLAIHNGGLSPKLSSRGSRLASDTSSPSLQSANLDDVSELAASSELANEYHTASEQPDSPKARSGPLIVDGSIYASRQSNSPSTRSGPLIVDGSVYSPQRRRPTIKPPVNKNEGCNLSASTSDDLGIDTPSSSDDQYQEYRKTSLAKRRSQHGTTHIVNGLSDHLRHLSVGSQIPSAKPVVDENLTSIDELKDGLEFQDDRISPSTAPVGENVSINASELRMNGSLSRRKKSRVERDSPVDIDSPTEAGIPLGPRTNGLTASTSSPVTAKHTDVSSGWQTQKKKKKTRKIVRSENDASLVNSAGGELLPLDESLRKGG